MLWQSSDISNQQKPSVIFPHKNHQKPSMWHIWRFQPPWKILISQIGSSSPIWLGKIKAMFQTTNQWHNSLLISPTKNGGFSNPTSTAASDTRSSCSPELKRLPRFLLCPKTRGVRLGFWAYCLDKHYYWLVVEPTPLKNMSNPNNFHQPQYFCMFMGGITHI